MTRRLLRAGAALACALALVATLTAVSPAADAAEIPYQLSKLDNGLPVYCCADDGMGPYVAVRLVVFPPPSLPGSPEHRVFDSLARSLFRSEDKTDDLADFLEKTPSAFDLSVGYHTAIFAFDVLPAQMDSLFARIARQWETGLRQTQIDRGRAGLTNLERWRNPPAIEELVLLTGCDWKDMFEAKSADVAALFRSHMSAGNMALILAGSQAGVDRAMGLAKRLERIPAGERSAGDRAVYGDLLRGRVEWPYEGPWAMGLRVSVPRDADPAVGHFLYTALLCKLNDLASFRDGLVYGISGSLLMSAGEYLMVFEPYVDTDVVDYDDLAKAMRRIGRDMADASTMSWWTTYTEGKRAVDHAFWAELFDASVTADVLTDFVMYARMTGRDEIGRPYLPSTQQARSDFAAMLESAEWFVVAPPYPWTEMLSETAEEVIAYVWGDLFGPTDDKRALAVLCQCLLVLVAFRRVEKRMERKTLKRPPA